ncbi:DUF4190 domain-containing protein [Micromonospora sp. NPDC003197]
MTYPNPDEPQDPQRPPDPYGQQQPESGSSQPSYGQPGQPGGQHAEYGHPGQPSGQHGEYGQPGQYGGQYGQYGQPGYPPPGQGQHRGMNVLAILSLVFAFVFAPAGIALGHIARKQIKQTGEQGDQLAFWGLILSYIFTGLYLIACCAWVVLIFWAGSDSGTTY